MSRAARAPVFLCALLFAGACERCSPTASAPSAAGADAAMAPSASPSAAPSSGQPAITGVSPRVASNQTDVPLFVFGRSLTAAQKLHLGSPFNRDVPLQVVDPGFATARLPKDLAMPPEFAEVKVPLVPADEEGMLLGEGVDLVVVNDVGLPDLQQMVATSDLLYAFVLSPTSDEILRLDTTTGAVSGMPVGDGPSAIALAKIDGVEQLVVAHRYAKELRVITARPDAKGQHSQRAIAAPDRALAVSELDGVAFVLEGRTSTVVAIALHDGAELWRSVPLPGATLMKAYEGSLVVSGPHKAMALLLSKTGARVETKTRDLEGLDPGLPAIWDAWTMRSYEADLGAGVLREIDLNHRISASIPLPAPSALALSQDGQGLLVLERFAGKIARLDVRRNKVVKELPVIDPPAQADRRDGRAAFFAGKQSCASCHAEGQGLRDARDLSAVLATPAHAAVPPKDPEAVRKLAAHVDRLTAPPSPWRDANGGLLAKVPLADGRQGDAQRGGKLFLSGCSSNAEGAALAALFDRTRGSVAAKVIAGCASGGEMDEAMRADLEAFILSL